MIYLAIIVKEELVIRPKMLAEEAEVVVTMLRHLAAELPAHSLSKSKMNLLSPWSITKRALLAGVVALLEAEGQGVEELVMVLVPLLEMLVVALLAEEVEVAAREEVAEGGEIGRRSVIYYRPWAHAALTLVPYRIIALVNRPLLSTPVGRCWKR